MPTLVILRNVCLVALGGVLVWLGEGRAAAPPGMPQPILEVVSRFEVIALSPDGDHLAFIGPRDHATGKPFVELWRLGATQRTARVSLSGESYGRVHGAGAMCFTPDSRSLLIHWLGFDDKAKKVELHLTRIDVKTGRALRSLQIQAAERQSRAALSPDGKTLAVNAIDAAAILYDTETMKENARLKGDEKLPGDYSAAARAGKGPPQRVIVYENHAASLLFSPDSKHLAIGTDQGWLSVWDLGRGKRLWREKMATYWIRHLSFSADGATLGVVVPYIPKNLYLLQTRDGKPSLIVRDRCDQAAVFLPDGDMLMERCNRVGFFRWNPALDTESGTLWGRDLRRESGTLAAHADPAVYRKVTDLGALVVSANGEKVALTSGETRVVVYDLASIWPKKK